MRALLPCATHSPRGSSANDVGCCAQVLASNDSDEIEANVERVAAWARQFCAARGCAL
jgi:hypothetical protein